MTAYKLWTGAMAWLDGCEEPVFEVVAGFEDERDGRVTVSHLPARILITDRMLFASGGVLQRRGRTLTIITDNLSGTYRLARQWGSRYDRVFGASKLDDPGECR